MPTTEEYRGLLTAISNMKLLSELTISGARNSATALMKVPGFDNNEEIRNEVGINCGKIFKTMSNLKITDSNAEDAAFFGTSAENCLNNRRVNYTDEIVVKNNVADIREGLIRSVDGADALAKKVVQQDFEPITQ